MVTLLEILSWNVFNFNCREIRKRDSEEKYYIEKATHYFRECE